MQKNVIDAISFTNLLAIIQNLKYRKLWPRPQEIQKVLTYVRLAKIVLQPGLRSLKMIKVFKEADIKLKIAIIISWSMFVLALVNIFTENELLRTIIWVGVVIALILDYLHMLQLYQRAEKELYEERKRRVKFASDLNALRFRIEIDGLNRVETGEELGQIIERCLNDDM